MSTKAVVVIQGFDCQNNYWRPKIEVWIDGNSSGVVSMSEEYGMDDSIVTVNTDVLAEAKTIAQGLGVTFGLLDTVRLVNPIVG